MALIEEFGNFLQERNQYMAIGCFTNQPLDYFSNNFFVVAILLQLWLNWESEECYQPLSFDSSQSIKF